MVILIIFIVHNNEVIPMQLKIKGTKAKTVKMS